MDQKFLMKNILVSASMVISMSLYSAAGDFMCPVKVQEDAIGAEHYSIRVCKSMGGWRISVVNGLNEKAYVTLQIDGSIGEIERLFVDRSYRHKGLGSMLLKMGVDKLLDLGCQNIKVKPYPFEVADNFDVAKQRLIVFYGRFGFKIRGNDNEFLWANEQGCKIYNAQSFR